MAKAKTEAAAPEQQAGTALTEAQQHAVALMNEQFAKDAGAGFEDAGAEAYAIPFLQILQSGSPQCKRSDGAFIPGAEEGKFLNTVTQQIFDGDQGLILIPCHYTQRFIEWKPRDSGGGFVAEHLPTDPIVLTTQKDDENRDKLPNGNVLVDTRNHYCLLVLSSGIEPVVISMSSTQLKKSRNWMSKMQGFKVKVGDKWTAAPMASRQYRATTVPEKNDKGSWFGWKIELDNVVSDVSLYNAAMDFRNAVVRGRAKAQTPAEAPAEEDSIAA